MVPSLFPDTEQSPDDVVSIEMINECETELTNIITDDDIINFVVSYDPPGNFIPSTRSIFEILEDNGCEEIKSLWGAQMPEITHETEAIKLNNVKIIIKIAQYHVKT